MAARFHRHSPTAPDAIETCGREIPEMLRRSQEAPARAGKLGVKRIEVARGYHNDSIWVEVAAAERQRGARIGQMLNHIEQDDDVHHAKLRKTVFIRHSTEDAQAPRSAKVSRPFGQFDPADIEVRLRLLQEEPVGASQFQQAAFWAIFADKIDSPGEFTAQDRFRSAIVAVTVWMASGKIIVCIVADTIELAGLSPAKSAASALKNVAAVFRKQESMRGASAAGGAGKLREVVGHGCSTLLLARFPPDQHPECACRANSSGGAHLPGPPFRKTTQCLRRYSSTTAIVLLDCNRGWGVQVPSGGNCACSVPDRPADHRASPGMPNCWIALGYGGNETTYAALAADIIAGGITARPDVDADLYRFSARK
jgi:hypothetical protein